MHGIPALPIRLAEPGQPGEPIRDWLFRRTGGDRRSTERLITLIQQWSRMGDEGIASTAQGYAERWRVSLATSHRLLAEFRSLFPGEQDPTRLVALLWDGLTERYLGPDRIGALIDVRVARQPGPGLRDLREILPPITTGILEALATDPAGRELASGGTQYESYEASADRYAWLPQADGSGRYVTAILEGDADEHWLPAPGSAREHDNWADAEVVSAAAWANAQGLPTASVSVRLPTPVFRLAPGARPTRQDRTEQ